MAAFRRSVLVAVVLLCITYSGAAQCGPGGNDVKSLPSLETLAKLKYEPAVGRTFGVPATKQEITEAVRLAESFAGGSKPVGRFKEPERARGQTGVNVYRRASPAVVFIYSTTGPDQEKATGQGTGVLVDSRGLILTNWHVVEGFDRIIVFLKPERGAALLKSRAYVARFVSADQLKDLALVRLVEPPADLPAALLADATLLEVGQDIHVIGHPGGEEQAWSYTTGVVSQIRKNYRAEFEDSSPIQANVLQIQTAINPGNSGGPVLDDAGRMVGLVSYRRPSMQNISFAIECDEIAAFLDAWQKSRYRGAESPVPQAAPKAKFSRGTLVGVQKMTVLRVEYQGLTVYAIGDAATHPAGFVAQTIAGAVVTSAGTSPDDSWEARLPGGSAVRILRRGGQAYATEPI